MKIYIYHYIPGSQILRIYKTSHDDFSHDQYTFQVKIPEVQVTALIFVFHIRTVTPHLISNLIS